MVQRVKITSADIIICIAAVLLSLMLVFLLIGNEEDRVAVIEIDGKEYARYTLDGSAEFEEDIITPGGVNRIRVSGQGIEVISADCPGLIDVKRGMISKSGESIVCLPHRLVIYIEGENAVTDSISY